MCEICGRIIGHNPRCPNYCSPKVAHYCSSCGNGIYDGEEFIKNMDGEYRHYDCFNSTRELVEWLGCKVKIMEDNCEKDY